MSILFGTDGIRGKVGTYPIIPEFFFELGKVLAEVFKYYQGNKVSKFLIGRDTRISGHMLESALISGFTSMGTDVISVGVLPTAAVSYLTKKLEASAGLMITASHNLFEDNGIKIFDYNGYKISDIVQEHIEKLLIMKNTANKFIDNGLYGNFCFQPDALESYYELLKNFCKGSDFSDLKLVLDCSNGVASCIAPRIFKNFGAEVIEIANEPNGININQDVGSIYPQNLKKEVLAYKANFGIAFDGDSDRVIFCNHKGDIINGDQILALAAVALKRENKLNYNTLVVTEMTNLGVINSLKKKNIQVVSTLVGDRYVAEEMRLKNYSLGGENSGHIIFANASSTGDGILAALKIMKFILQQKNQFYNLLDSLELYPYQLKNINVNSKPPIETLSNILKILKICKKDLAEDGRYLLRYSGTENKIRILVEAKDKNKVDKWIEIIAKVIVKDIG